MGNELRVGIGLRVISNSPSWAFEVVAFRTDELGMTDVEVELVLEVLDSEHKRILTEVRHTDSRTLRKELVARARSLERIMERFRQNEIEAHAPGAHA
jgi:hypothetical protein